MEQSNGRFHLRLCKLQLQEARLRDSLWHERRSLQHTILPLGHSGYTSINQSTPLPRFLHSLLPSLSFLPLQNKTKNTMSCPRRTNLCASRCIKACITLGLHQIRAQIPQNTLPVMYFVQHCNSKEHKQPLAPQAENYFSHSISLASIMTVCLYMTRTPLANQIQRTAMWVQDNTDG